jgi:hypothetical protein
VGQRLDKLIYWVTVPEEGELPQQEVPRLPYSSRLGCVMIPILIVGVIVIISIGKAAGATPLIPAVLSGVWVLVGAFWVPRWKIFRGLDDEPPPSTSRRG